MADTFDPNEYTPSQLMLYQKQQEHAGLQALRQASAQLVERVEKLGEMSNVMADGGEGEIHFSRDILLDYVIRSSRMKG